MRSRLQWEALRDAVRAGARSVWRRLGQPLDPDEIEDVVSVGLIAFWRHTPEQLSAEHQVRRAWHFGANGMRNHLRSRLNPNNPGNPLNQVAWDNHEAARAAQHNPARELELRRGLERLRVHLSPADWEYLAAAWAADNRADLARTLGVSRSAVSKRLRHIHQRACDILAQDASAHSNDFV